jgi:hypothetical protein
MNKKKAKVPIIQLAFIGLLLSGCAKEGKPVEESRAVVLNFQAFTADAMRLGIKIDDEIMFNDFYTPSTAPRALRLYYYADRKKKITIYNTGENRVLFDSVFTLETGTKNITLYQQESGAPFIYIAPPANETLPPNGYGKLSMNYTFSALPERVEAVVRNSIAGGPAYDSTDGFILNKGEFSRYFLGRTMAGRKPEVLLYSTDPGRKLLAKIEIGEYTYMNSTFTIYSIRSSSAIQNGVYLLTQDKLY